MRVRSASVALAAAALAVATAAGCSPSREEPSTLTGTTEPTTTEPATTGTGEQPTTTGAEQPNQQVISVTVADGTVTPAPAPVDVRLGSTVVIEVTADVTDEIHVHGYDILQPVTAGQPARVEVQADVPGQFEVELESAHLLLVLLRVQ